MIIDIDFLFLSFILHSWSNLVLLSKINIFVWFNEYRGRWPIKHMKCVPWHCPPKQCGLTLQPTPAASRLGWFRCLPPFLRLTKHQTGVQCDEQAGTLWTTGPTHAKLVSLTSPCCSDWPCPMNTLKANNGPLGSGGCAGFNARLKSDLVLIFYFNSTNE